MPQDSLTSDPLEYNVNAEVFTLTGPVQQQDNEIAAFYRDAQINFGNKNVLGILATRNENFEHLIAKRDVRTTTENPDVSTTVSPDEPIVENLIYEAKGKGLLYTTVVPVLRITGGKKPIEYELKKHATVTADGKKDDPVMKMDIKFVVPEKTVSFKIFLYQSEINGFLSI